MSTITISHVPLRHDDDQYVAECDADGWRFQSPSPLVTRLRAERHARLFEPPASITG